MSKATAILVLAVVAAAALSLPLARTRAVHAASSAPASSISSWSPAAAARFMDSREDWWRAWPHAERDHGTRCISCHTQAPYALARPVLRSLLKESAPGPAETAMLADVQKRVSQWDRMLPFYDDKTYGKGKEIESRNAEAVLNAILLTSYDQPKGHLGELTRTAYKHAWALQSRCGPNAGAWVWQNFEFTPWESKESQYHWAALLAVSIGKAPDRYIKDAAIQTNLKLLTGYLSSHYDAQPTVNKVAALWASKWFPRVLTQQKKSALLAELYAKQRPGGGWSMNDLGTWTRRDGTPEETRPDGYATGLTALVLEETRPGPDTSEHLDHALAWLSANQNPETGAWPAWSLNRDRDPKNPVSLFMSDAATGYAVAALEEAQR